MLNFRQSQRALAAILIAISCVAPFHAHAQAVGVTAKPLLRTSVSGDERKEALVLSVEFAPGATTGRHTHYGDEYATVLEGSLEIVADGQAPRTIKAGEAYHNERGVVHETKNTGNVPARIISVFVVDKGKKLSTPAQ